MEFRRLRLAAVRGVLAGLLASAGAGLGGAEREDRGLSAHRRHPGRQVAAHPRRTFALGERTADIPPVVLEYLLADGALNGLPYQPRPHALTAAERSLVRATLAALPPEVARLADRFVAGVYFVDDLGSSAWTEFLDPPARQSFLVFDSGVLHETANAWATRRERSGFANPVDLRLELADPADDAAGGAFRFIFLHELGHAIAHGLRLHPTWIEPRGGEFSYARLMAGAPAYRPGVTFYAAPEQRTSAARLREIYAHWSASAHPTLYATTGLAEDFAEAFASHVHVHLLRQPYRVVVDGQVHANGIGEPRCARQREFIGRLLAP